jgi:hypothetical protein
LKASKPNSALTVKEVQEDVHRIIESGYFSACMPIAEDTRDGIRLIFQVLAPILATSFGLPEFLCYSGLPYLAFPWLGFRVFCFPCFHLGSLHLASCSGFSPSHN